MTSVTHQHATQGRCKHYADTNSRNGQNHVSSIDIKVCDYRYRERQTKPKREVKQASGNRIGSQ